MNKKAVILLLLVAFLFVKPAFAVVGDVNGDGKVDMKDLSIIARAFGSDPSDARWDPISDLNGDLKVDMKDLATAAANFGKSG